VLLFISLGSSEIAGAVSKVPLVFVSLSQEFSITDATLTDNALKAYAEVPYETVSTMVPCYLTDVDLVGAAQQGNILFGLTTWASGHQNTQPTSVQASAYDVLDELINYYLDAAKFPNLKAVVIAGHSLGAQMAQRYAAMRTSTTGDDKV